MTRHSQVCCMLRVDRVNTGLTELLEGDSEADVVLADKTEETENQRDAKLQ